jgi:hypothetical protein
MTKSTMIAAPQSRRFWESSRYQGHQSAAAALPARQARVREGFTQKLSTQLVRRNDVIGIQTLPLAAYDSPR